MEEAICKQRESWIWVEIEKTESVFNLTVVTAVTVLFLTPINFVGSFCDV